MGILAGLSHRHRTGWGQYIDLSLLDVQVACLANQAINYLASGVPPQPLGNSHPNIVPYQEFPTSDGYMIIAVGNDLQFAQLCAVAGMAELASESRYKTNKLRMENRQELIGRLAAGTVTRTTAT